MTKKVAYIKDICPGDWAPDSAQVFFEREAHGLPEVFPSVPVIRGRKRWLIALPALVLKPDSLSLTGTQEADLVRHAIDARREAPLGFFKPLKEVRPRAGRGFYSALFLEQVGPFLALPATAAALAVFARALDQGQVRPDEVPSTKSPSTAKQGWARLWQPWEDAVIRAWFGVRTFGEHEGRHAKLTEREWELVLHDHLKGHRTQRQVKVRVTVLNRQLRRSLLVDGFLPRDKVREFQDRALGERRIRVPRFRPRIKGRSYRGESLPPVLDQPL